MIEISEKLMRSIDKEIKLGFYSENEGAVIGDAEFIIVYKDMLWNKYRKIYLAHKSEFEFDGVLVRLKKKNES